MCLYTFPPLLSLQVVRRRQLSTSAHMDFSPVFDSFEHSSSRQVLKQLTFQTPLITNEIAQVPTQSVNRHILCLKVRGVTGFKSLQSPSMLRAQIGSTLVTWGHQNSPWLQNQLQVATWAWGGGRDPHSNL